MNNNTSFQYLSTLIFLATFFVGIIASITVLFPTLIIRVFGGLNDYSGLDVFEFGALAPYWIVSNLSIIIIAILYKKNKLKILERLVFFITNFEISKKVSFVAIAIIIGIYFSMSFHEIFEEEPYEDYRLGGKETIENWKPSDITSRFTYHVRLFLDFVSFAVFGNYKVIPFLASISLLILTYYTTKEFTKKRFPGIIALVLVLQSGTFLIYDTSITYDNYWILFYLLSLYVILKVWWISPISFILSLLSKHLSIIFAPMTLFLVYSANMQKKTKILLSASYIGIITTGFFVTGGYTTKSIGTPFDWHDFWMALNSISYQMRYDGLIMIFLLPVLVSLFFAMKNGIKYAQTVTVLILGTLLSQSVLAALTIDSSEPYRFMPFVVFFAISCGVLFSKIKDQAVEPV